MRGKCVELARAAKIAIAVYEMDAPDTPAWFGHDRPLNDKNDAYDHGTIQRQRILFLVSGAAPLH